MAQRRTIERGVRKVGELRKAEAGLLVPPGEE